MVARVAEAWEPKLWEKNVWKSFYPWLSMYLTAPICDRYMQVWQVGTFIHSLNKHSLSPFSTLGIQTENKSGHTPALGCSLFLKERYLSPKLSQTHNLGMGTGDVIAFMPCECWVFKPEMPRVSSPRKKIKEAVWSGGGDNSMEKETICKDTVPGRVEENKTGDNICSTVKSIYLVPAAGSSHLLVTLVPWYLVPFSVLSGHLYSCAHTHIWPTRHTY